MHQIIIYNTSLELHYKYLAIKTTMMTTLRFYNLNHVAMLTHIPLKNLLPGYIVMAIILIVLLSSCEEKAKVTIVEAAAANADVPGIDITKESDKQFLLRAADILYEEILVGKLAQTRAGTPEIKELAKMLENASRETKMKLGSLAIIKSIPVPSVPTPAAHAAYDTLNKESIEDFDYVYLRKAVQRHHDVITHFESAGHQKLDPDIKSYASATLPALRQQLTKVQELDARMNPISETVLSD
jgi:putative membrane protein